jgi:hypothetical protein
MKQLIAAAMIAAGVAAPIVAHATSVTYQFNGYVEYADGSLFTDAGITGGTAVSGTYTFDLMDPSATLQQGSAPIGSTAAWGLLLADSMSAVFSSTLKVGSILYTSALPSNGAATSEVSGGPYNTTGQYLNASESNTLGIVDGVQVLSSFFNFYSCYNGCGGTLPLGEPAYSATGLPVSFYETSPNYLNSNVYGGINLGGNTDYMVYHLTDLYPAPLPRAVWLLLSGLAGLGFMATKRRMA